MGCVSDNFDTGNISKNTLLNGRYVVLNLLGRGGMGAVYKAADIKLENSLVAIKEMSTANLDESRLERAIENFKKEASMLINLRHNALPRVRDFFTDGSNKWFLVMDYIRGENLEAVLKKQGQIAEKVLTQWFLELAEVLDYIHNQDPPIIFRDLKPANIMLTSDNHIKLIDFGIARHFQPDKSSDTTYYVSQGFSPPEQYGIHQSSVQSDIYALGAVCYYLLTGRHPQGEDFSFTPPQEFVTVSEGLNRAIMKAIQYNPKDRPTSIKKMLAIYYHGDDNNYDNKPDEVTRKPDRTFKWSRSIVVTITLVLVLGLGYLFFQGNERGMGADQAIIFTDNSLSNHVKYSLGLTKYDTLTKEYTEDIKVLQLEDKGIETLDGIEALTSLRELYLDDNPLKDIGAIKELEQLEVLSIDIFNPQITNLNALVNLTNLKELYVTCNLITDISPLENLKALRILHLFTHHGQSQIKNIEIIGSLINLEELRLEGNSIRDIDFLEELSNLKWLDLGRNFIEDIEVLKELENLEGLNLRVNNISDIEPLLALSKLEDLDLSSNQKINNIHLIRELSGLKSLGLNNTNLDDLSFLDNLIRLERLGAGRNNISDLSPLSKLKDMKYLYLSDNNIRTIEDLFNLEKLITLDISRNPIESLEQIKELPKNIQVTY